MSSDTELMFQLTQLLQKNLSADDILKQSVCLAAEMADAQQVVIALYDNISRELYYRITGGKSTEYDNDFFRFNIGQGIIGWVAEHKTAVRIINAQQDDRFDPQVDNKFQIQINSLLSLPMIYLGRFKGVLHIINKINSNSFSKKDEQLLSLLAVQIAGVLENYQLAEENLNQSLLSHIGQNIANSAHGIKNILNNIDGGTFIVERGVASHKMELVDKGWEIMKRNSARLRDLVLDMLLFSRPKEPEYVYYDINKVCCDIYELIKEKAQKEKVKIELDLDTSIGQVYIDPKGIYRAILNLVSNAISSFDKKESGCVKILTKLVSSDNFKIVVSDNGSGISKENLNHIFDIFFTTKGSKGTGLGLPVTRKIIMEHQGEIDVVSRLNEGTVFTIYMPRKK